MVIDLFNKENDNNILYTPIHLKDVDSFFDVDDPISVDDVEKEVSFLFF